MRLFFLNISDDLFPQLQDFVDQEYIRDLQRPPSKSSSDPAPPREPTQGFVVKDAPWDRAPDTASQEEFPSFGAVVAPKGRSWGPIRK